MATRYTRPPAGRLMKIENRLSGYSTTPITAPASRMRQLSLITPSRSSGWFRWTNHQPNTQSEASVSTVVVLAAREPKRGMKIRLRTMLIAAASTTTVLTEASLCVFGWWFVQRNHPELRLGVIRLSWRILLAGAVMGVVLY